MTCNLHKLVLALADDPIIGQCHIDLIGPRVHEYRDLDFVAIADHGDVLPFQSATIDRDGVLMITSVPVIVTPSLLDTIDGIRTLIRRCTEHAPYDPEGEHDPNRPLPAVPGDSVAP